MTTTINMRRRLLLAAGLIAASGAWRSARSQESGALKAIVIGAGAAGLKTAHDLHKAGIQTTILEARLRIGGRVWSDDSLGATIDLGGAWIHGVRGNPLTALARQYGVTTRPTDYDDLIAFDAGRRASEQELVYAAELGETLEAYLEAYAETLPYDVTIQQAIDAVIAAERPSPEDLRAFSWVQSAQTLAAGADMHDLSFAYTGSDDGFGGGDRMFPGGYGQLMQGLAQDLDIRLGHVVQGIEYGEEGVRVTTDQGTFEADGAICTLPLGVLRHGSVKFSPSLSQTHDRAIFSLGMGVLNKVAMRFPSDAWPLFGEAANYQFIARRPQLIGEIASFLNMHPHTGQPIWVGFTAGSQARALERMSDAKAVDVALGMLREIFGTSLPTPERAVVTRWHQDPFARGSYSHIPVGATPQMYDDLAEPLAGGVLGFAGEHTTSRYPGTVHGAYLSGQREAQRVLELI